VTSLLFVHGWGFDAGFWTPVTERLPDFQREAVDLGFRGPGHRPSVSRPIVVAHSMGFAWALANLPRPWAGVVAVNAFPRFTRAPDFVSGVGPRLVERMIEKFADEPEAVTADFLRRCGVETPDTASPRTEPLGEALRWLAVCDEREALAGLDCPLVALAGTRDLIVPEPMSREAFARHSLVLAEGGGHLLPQTHPDWVAQRIRQFAAGAS
jgi:pimeloyl-[acyl-carrier protein] methyl ester esterase